MDKIIIESGYSLKGTIPIAGSKNASLPIMAACLLIDEPVKLLNLPHLNDVTSMFHLLIDLGAELQLNGVDIESYPGKKSVTIECNKIINYVANYELVRKMRASMLILGPMLTKFGKADISLPGGCTIGTRPIDLHLSAFEQMGATISLDHGYVKARATSRLKGAEINFAKISVGATENVLMAAVLAEGRTILNNAAQEPEVTDLANFLKSAGAKIEGIGNSTIIIDGVDSLHSTNYFVCPDRIEAATYAIAAAITDGDVIISGINIDIFSTVYDIFSKIGIVLEQVEGGVRVRKSSNGFSPVFIETNPYPNFPTDVQAQIMSLLSITKGTSFIKENVFENRFMHVAELRRMGANIIIDDNTAEIRGIDHLIGAEVMATDLRASVSLIIAGLVASGETVVNRVYHIDRGYEFIENKLASCGARIRRSR